jgi:hypothetical protein
LTATLSLRRLASALALGLSLGVLAAAALLGPAQTLAQTHRATCPSSGAHSKAKHGHGCAKPARKGKSHRTAKHHAKRTKTKAGSSASGAFVPARCEDGSLPVAAANGSFSCDDGSEPECENGAAPTRSSKDKKLLCPVSTHNEPGAGEAECEEREEQEEENLSCTTEGGEEVCEVTSTPGCEAAS